MISDVLSEAEESIEKYLAWDNCPYGKPGEPFRDAIDNLLAHMKAIRFLPGLDYPPDDAKEVIDLLAIRSRFGPPSDGSAPAFPRATLDDMLNLPQK